MQHNTKIQGQFGLISRIMFQMLLGLMVSRADRAGALASATALGLHGATCRSRRLQPGVRGRLPALQDRCYRASNCTTRLVRFLYRMR